MLSAKPSKPSQTNEREASQAWESIERQLDREFTTAEREATQAFLTGERLSTQEWQSLESALGRQFTTSEREAMQSFTASERLATQQWQSFEAVLDRDLRRTIAADDREHDITILNESMRADLNRTITSTVAGLSGEAFRWVVKKVLGINDTPGGLGSWLTASNILSQASGDGIDLSPEQAGQIAEIMGATNADGTVPLLITQPKRAYLGSMGRAVKRFGGWIAANPATAFGYAAGAAIAGYGVYRLYGALFGEEATKGLSPEESAVRWYSSLSPEQQAEIDELYAGDAQSGVPDGAAGPMRGNRPPRGLPLLTMRGQAANTISLGKKWMA